MTVSDLDRGEDGEEVIVIGEDAVDGTAVEARTFVNFPAIAFALLVA